MVTLMGQHIRASKEDEEKIYCEARIGQFFCNTCGLLSVGVYVFGMIMITYSLYISYFAY